MSVPQDMFGDDVTPAPTSGFGRGVVAPTEGEPASTDVTTDVTFLRSALTQARAELLAAQQACAALSARAEAAGTHRGAFGLDSCCSSVRLHGARVVWLWMATDRRALVLEEELARERRVAAEGKLQLASSSTPDEAMLSGTLGASTSYLLAATCS